MIQRLTVGLGMLMSFVNIYGYVSAQDLPRQARKGLPQEAAVSLERVATGYRMAEGPVWDGESLQFSDVPASRILKLSSDGKVKAIRSDTRWGAGLAFDSKRRLIICQVMGRCVTRVEEGGTETTLAESYEGKKLNGPNDLTVDAKDGIYFTDPLFLNKDKREQDKEAVYYIRPDGKVLRVADDMERPNGIALAGDGKTLFVADTAKSKLRAYPVNENGTLGEGRDFGSVNGPDGVKVDLDGNVYAAGRGGITVWYASGKRFGTLKIPTPPNSLAFGDTDRRMMYITTPPSLYRIRIDQALNLLTADEPADTTETVHQRVATKVERVKAGARRWAAGGRDPSAIGTTMEEKVKPLLEASKFIEADAELDRVLEQLEQNEKSTESPTAPTQSGKGAIRSNPSRGPTASSGQMRLTEPAPLDFNDHKGYVSLFDGVSLKNWDGHPKFWRVENGAIIGESTAKNPSGNQYLVYRGFEAKDFTLKFEMKVDGKGGTGFQYRSKTGIPWLMPISPVVAANVGPVNLNWMMTGPQADFWPSEIYTGQFYSENTPMRVIAWRGQVVESYGLARKRLMGKLGDRRALGECVKKDDWNQCTVIARGGTCIHIVNGQVMAVLIDDDPASSNNQSGLFGIEIESITKLYVKNIWVKKLN